MCFEYYSHVHMFQVSNEVMYKCRIRILVKHCVECIHAIIYLCIIIMASLGLGPLIVDFPTSDKTRAVKDGKVLGWHSKEHEAAFRRQQSLHVMTCSAMLMQGGHHNDYSQKVSFKGAENSSRQDLITRI